MIKSWALLRKVGLYCADTEEINMKKGGVLDPAFLYYGISAADQMRYVPYCKPLILLEKRGLKGGLRSLRKPPFLIPLSQPLSWGDRSLDSF